MLIDPAQMSPGFPSLTDGIEAVQTRSLNTVYTVRNGKLELPSAPTSHTDVIAHAFTIVELVISRAP
jgi:hypothetical protein